MKALENNIQASILKGSLYIAIFAIGMPFIYLLLALSLDFHLGNAFERNILPVRILGIIAGLTGLYIIINATLKLNDTGKGLPLSSSPPLYFVTDGPYAWSRHPIYLGAFILYSGIFLFISSFWGLILAAPLLGIFYFSYARGIEEPVLLERYGIMYRKYRKKVPLIILYPFRSKIHRWSGSILQKITDVINNPKIIHINNHILFWGYGIWPGLGVMVGLAFMEYILLSQNIPSSITAGLIVILTILGLLCVRLTWRIITAIRKHLHFKKTAGIVGFMSWGTLLAIVITLFLFELFTSYSVTYLLDATLPGILIAHFFGRIGCMFYGCCYGKKTDGACGLLYYHPDLKVIRIEHINEKRVIPIQLFSSLYGLAGCVVIFLLWFQNTLPAGFPASITAVWYGSLRLDEEWLREQSITWLNFIEPAQVVSFIILLAGLTGLLWGSTTPVIQYRPLITGQNIMTVLGSMHYLLLLISGLLTALVFSYHYKEIGKWR